MKCPACYIQGCDGDDICLCECHSSDYEYAKAYIDETWNPADYLEEDPD